MSKSIWERIESSRERWDVLRHPFYQRWSAGELTAPELARYSGQYRHAVEAIAEMSDSVAEALPERDELRRHAAEELGHVRLWDGFLEEVGGDAAADPTPETAECVRTWTANGRRARDARPPLRGREWPASDLAHEARGPARALRRSRMAPAPPTSGSTRPATSSTPPRRASCSRSWPGRTTTTASSRPPSRPSARTGASSTASSRLSSRQGSAPRLGAVNRWGDRLLGIVLGPRDRDRDRRRVRLRVQRGDGRRAVARGWSEDAGPGAGAAMRRRPNADGPRAAPLSSSWARSRSISCAT